MAKKKEKRGRPSIDLVQYLVDHPNHRDSSYDQLAEALGVTRPTVKYQIGKALKEKKIYIRSVIEPFAPNGAKNNRGRLGELSSDEIMRQYEELYIAREQYQSTIPQEQKREYIRNYKRRWRLVGDNGARETANTRAWYLGLKKKKEKYKKRLQVIAEQARERKRKQKNNNNQTK